MSARMYAQTSCDHLPPSLRHVHAFPQPSFRFHTVNHTLAEALSIMLRNAPAAYLSLSNPGKGSREAFVYVHEVAGRMFGFSAAREEGGSSPQALCFHSRHNKSDIPRPPHR